ncbi:MAG: hypothetical protein H3C26_02590 [Rhodocyclaceae bacterium]|nr:hypothetical protein [Rhodocyclaceae bacterium]
MIRTRLKRAWSAIPDDILTDRRLSPTARLVLAYCLGRPADWDYYPAQIQSALGIGRDAWQAARRALETVGYLAQDRRRNPDGTWVWGLVVTDESDPETTGLSSTGLSGTGSASDGEGVDITHVHDAHGRAAACTPTADAAAAQQQKRKHPNRTPHGIEAWYPSEDAQAADIEAKHASDLIAAAVAAVKSQPNSQGKPTSPVPVLVAREIDRQQRDRDAAACRAAADEAHRAQLNAAPSADPAAVKRGAAILAAARRRNQESTA